MIEFIDETATENGTPINRANLMAIQGFIGSATTFKPNAKDDAGVDHDVKQVNSKGEKLYIDFNSNGTITKTLVGEKTIKHTTSFIDGGVVENLEG